MNEQMSEFKPYGTEPWYQGQGIRFLEKIPFNEENIEAICKIEKALKESGVAYYSFLAENYYKDDSGNCYHVECYRTEYEELKQIIEKVKKELKLNEWKYRYDEDCGHIIFRKFGDYEVRYYVKDEESSKKIIEQMDNEIHELRFISTDGEGYYDVSYSPEQSLGTPRYPISLSLSDLDMISEAFKKWNECQDFLENLYDEAETINEGW